MYRKHPATTASSRPFPLHPPSLDLVPLNCSPFHIYPKLPYSYIAPLLYPRESPNYEGPHPQLPQLRCQNLQDNLGLLPPPPQRLRIGLGHHRAKSKPNHQCAAPRRLERFEDHSLRGMDRSPQLVHVLLAGRDAFANCVVL